MPCEKVKHGQAPVPAVVRFHDRQGRASSL